MGSKCGPSIANLFVYILEIKWTHIHKPLIYFRFIDDVFLILDRSEHILSFQKSFGNLRLNFKSGSSVNFLDLEIFINEVTKYLNFKIYFKPTNTFCYLYSISNNPDYIFKNIIKSVFIRIRRICSSLNDFIYFANTISRQFIKRGYDKYLVDKTFTMVCKLNRDSLLNYKIRENIDFSKNFIFKLNFDRNILNMKSLVKNSFEALKKVNKKFENKTIFIVNNMQSNICSLLVHNFKFPFVYKKFP